jgi:hypothetical protein
LKKRIVSWLEEANNLLMLLLSRKKSGKLMLIGVQQWLDLAIQATHQYQ